MHDNNALDESVKANGQYRSIVARVMPDGSAQILAGHGTRAALTRSGVVSVRVELIEADDTEARRINLVDNAAQRNADYDETALLALLDAASQDGGLAGTGWDAEAYQELLNTLDEGNPFDWQRDPDTTDAQLPEHPITQAGDIWTLGPHRLICADASDPQAHARVLAGDHVATILTDPPYGMALDADWSQVNGHTYSEVAGDHADYDPRPLIEMYASVREQFWFGADYYAERLPAKNDGSWLVWDKRTDTQGDGFGAEFELCWSRARHKRRTLRHPWFGFLTDSDNAKDIRNRVHPTQKPVTLFTDIIDQWVSAGAIVLDPYAGSGSVLIACHASGRINRSIELMPGYCDAIARRWQQVTGVAPVRNDRIEDMGDS